MLCQQCRQRPASVHVTKIVNGRKTESHLCEQCARETGELGAFAEPQSALQSFLAGILEQHGMTAQPAGTQWDSSQRCPNCGLSYKDFARTGKLGCSKCYETFGDRLEPVLRRVHGSTQHTGKVPTRSGDVIRLRRDLRELREKLSAAVAAEEFEKAAKLRDEIKKLEKELG